MKTNLLLLHINVLIFLKLLFESEIDTYKESNVSNVVVLFRKSTFKTIRSLCILNWDRKIIFQH